MDPYHTIWSNFSVSFFLTHKNVFCTFSIDHENFFHSSKSIMIFGLSSVVYYCPLWVGLGFQRLCGSLCVVDQIGRLTVVLECDMWPHTSFYLFLQTTKLINFSDWVRNSIFIHQIKQVMLLLQINFKDMEMEDDKNNEMKVESVSKKVLPKILAMSLSNTEVIILHYQILLDILEP